MPDYECTYNCDWTGSFANKEKAEEAFARHKESVPNPSQHHLRED